VPSPPNHCPKLTKAILEKGGRDYAAIIAEWPAIVGAALAADSLPEKLARRALSRACVRPPVCYSPAGNWCGRRMEFQHREPQLIERINSFSRAIARWSALKLIQGHDPGPVRPAEGGRSAR